MLAEEPVRPHLGLAHGQAASYEYSLARNANAKRNKARSLLAS
jgi:hypothetical protein